MLLPVQQVKLYTIMNSNYKHFKYQLQKQDFIGEIKGFLATVLIELVRCRPLTFYF